MSMAVSSRSVLARLRSRETARLVGVDPTLRQPPSHQNPSQPDSKDRDAMRARFEAFALSLHPDKTRLIEFGRHAAVRRERRGLAE
jgi:hypothetical protein